MSRPPPSSTRTDTLFPHTTLFRSLSGEGFTFVTPGGSTRHLLFGEPADQVVEAVSRALGSQPEHGHNDECGAGPLDMATWPNGLTLVAQDDRFAGWSLSPQARAGMEDGLGHQAGNPAGRPRRPPQTAPHPAVGRTPPGTTFNRS